MMVKRPCSEADVLMVQDMLVFAGVLAMPLTAYEQGNAVAGEKISAHCAPCHLSKPSENERDRAPAITILGNEGGEHHLPRKDPGRISPGPRQVRPGHEYGSISCRTRKTGRRSSRSAGFWRPRLDYTEHGAVETDIAFI